MHRLVLGIGNLLFLLIAADAAAASEAEVAQDVAAWYHAVDGRRVGESFGALAARAGRAQLGRPFVNTPTLAESETLSCDLTGFDCVTFVESSLAIAHCVWQQTPSEACFLNAVESLRYRNGVIDGYASRLHYYADWLDDNARRGHLRLVGDILGGKPKTFPVFYMTHHRASFPPLADPEVFLAMQAHERRLSQMPVYVIDREAVKSVSARLKEGDVISIVTRQPGLLIKHTGFVSLDDGVVRMLHASGLRHHVVITLGDLAGYVLASEDRIGIIVARPRPPAVGPS